MPRRGHYKGREDFPRQAAALYVRSQAQIDGSNRMTIADCAKRYGVSSGSVHAALKRMRGAA